MEEGAGVEGFAVLGEGFAALVVEALAAAEVAFWKEGLVAAEGDVAEEGLVVAEAGSVADFAVVVALLAELQHSRYCASKRMTVHTAGQARA